LDPIREHQRTLTRRQFFGRTATGIGTAALAWLLGREGYAASGGIAGLPHFAPKAKRVIYLFQNGAPTHVDLFDYKPKLKEMHGKPVPEEYVGGKRFSTMTGSASGKLMLAPVEPFSQRGNSGAWVSNFLPHTATIADDLCFVKGMHTEQVNHAPAITFLLTGGEQPGRPSMGRVADLWPRFDERQSARLRRHDLDQQGHDLWADFLRLLLGFGVPAVPVPGGQVPRQRRSRALPLQP
jgi:hypothetical protein